MTEEQKPQLAPGSQIVPLKRAPLFGFDNFFDVQHMQKYLKNVDNIIFEPANGEEHRCIKQAYRCGISEIKLRKLFEERWPEISGKMLIAIGRRIDRFYAERNERAGTESVGMPPNLEPGDIDEHENKIAPRQTGGLSWNYGSESTNGTLIGFGPIVSR